MADLRDARTVLNSRERSAKGRVTGLDEYLNG
jgi:hypothetical protein